MSEHAVESSKPHPATSGWVLVAYASAAGSTAGIAERIARGIGRTGHAVACEPADRADLVGVEALVLGSAVHDMAWLPSASDLLRRTAVAGIPVWCFSVGAVQPRGPLTRLMARLEAQRVAAGFPPGVLVRDHQVFRGVVRLRGVPWWGRLVYRAMSGRPGDHRDWAAVDRWAARVAAELAQEGRPHQNSD